MKHFEDIIREFGVKLSLFNMNLVLIGKEHLSCRDIACN
jgi:hypothetical protein